MSETRVIVDSWDDTASTIGELLPVIDGADAVTKGWIRQWNEVIEADCPLHYDVDLAKSMGFNDVVAPAGLVFAAAAPAYWEPGMELGRTGPLNQPNLSVMVPKPKTSMGFATDIEVEFLLPVYPGDMFRQEGRLISVTPKRLKVGDGAFFTVETAFVNQRDETVAVQRVTTWCGNPVKEGE